MSNGHQKPANIESESLARCHDWATKWLNAAVTRLVQGSKREEIMDALLTALDWEEGAISKTESNTPNWGLLHRVAAQIALDLEQWPKAYELALHGLTGSKTEAHIATDLTRIMGTAARRQAEIDAANMEDDDGDDEDVLTAMYR